jgi:hypothetical protein
VRNRLSPSGLGRDPKERAHAAEPIGRAGAGGQPKGACGGERDWWTDGPSSPRRVLGGACLSVTRLTVRDAHAGRQGQAEQWRGLGRRLLATGGATSANTTANVPPEGVVRRDPPL